MCYENTLICIRFVLRDFFLGCAVVRSEARVRPFYGNLRWDKIPYRQHLLTDLTHNQAITY